jgi:hypothetical protein
MTARSYPWFCSIALALLTPATLSIFDEMAAGPAPPPN